MQANPLQTKLTNTPIIDVASLDRIVLKTASLIAPFEERERARSTIQTAKHKAALEDIISRLASRAALGRGWEDQPAANGYLKGKGGPGKCAQDIVIAMEKAGLIQLRKFYCDRTRGTGRPNAIRATERFRSMMFDCGVPIAGGFPPVTTTILREGTGDMPDAVRQQDKTVKAFNAMAGQKRLGWSDGTSAHDVYLVRKFKTDWSMGGRLFGGCWQAMSECERADLRIDGEPVAELDFACMQPRILFAMRGIKLDFDPYLVPGFDGISREVGKLAYYRLTNRQGNSNRACPINFDKAFKSEFESREQFVSFIQAMQKQLSAVQDLFDRDAWGLLQREESELMLSIISRMVENQIPHYPIHDSLIVKQSDKENTRLIMLEEFMKRYGVEGEIKI